MNRRKDKNNRVLRDGESYREKENRYMYRWTGTDGKRHCIYAQTLVELRQKEKAVALDASEGIRTDGGNMTLDNIYGLWRENKVGLKQSTFVNYQYVYGRYIQPKLGKCKIREIRKSTIRGLYNGLMRDNDVGRAMAINTLEIVHNVLRQILQVAVDDDYIRKNPVDGVLSEIKKANHYEVPKRHALTIEQQNAFVHFLKSNPTYRHWSTLFAVLLGTGCRIAEFVGLRWCDADFDRNVISINHNLIYRPHLDGKCYLSITTPKTKAGCRMIPMLPDVRQALLDEKERQAELGIKCQTIVDGYTDFIFLNRFNEPYHPPVINRAIKRISMEYNRMEMDKAEAESREAILLPPFSCHNLRHTFCTRLCENEPNIKVIQDIMGHADIQTTMNIYTDVQKELKESCIQNLSGKVKVY